VLIGGNHQRTDRGGNEVKEKFEVFGHFDPVFLRIPQAWNWILASRNVGSDPNIQPMAFHNEVIIERQQSALHSSMIRRKCQAGLNLVIMRSAEGRGG